MLRECYWCLKKYYPKPKSTRQKFCTRKCQLAHWRARNGERLRKYFIKYRKDNIQKIRSFKRNWNRKNTDYRHLWYLANASAIKTELLLSSRHKMRSRQQAKRVVKKLGWIRKCSICHTTKNVQLHHQDGNPLNNKIKNLVYLCKKDHMLAHIRMNLRKIKK